MRTIPRSDDPPACLGAVRSGTPWEEFSRSPCHGDVHEVLRREQGGLCCYCESRLDQPGAHIEHMRPKSLFPKEQYRFANLALSCDQRGENRHCGHAKGNSYDRACFRDPHDPDTEGLFEYTALGEVRAAEELAPRDRAAAEWMIRTLNLNAARLIQRRRNHWRALAATIGRRPSFAVLDWLTAEYLDAGNDGSMREYPSVARAVLFPE
jgi:uncharacterized protein (TIGR02646 family)